MGNVTEKLVDFALFSAQPDRAALAVMRLSMLDWLAVGRAGGAEPVARIMRELALAEAGTPQAHLLGGGVAPMRMAALVNATISHALDYDDTHFDHIGHASVAVIPAALAVAEARRATGDDFLQACLIGVEAAVRVGVFLGRSHYQAGFHQTATSGAFGACLAAARLMGLTTTQCGHALGIVSTKAAGLKSQFGTMGKPYNAGLAASAGVEAAQLAALGFLSNPDALTAPLGFAATHHGERDLEGFEGMGEVWRFIAVQHKFHACCHGLHAMLEAINSLAPLPDPTRITEVEITTHSRWLSVCNQPTPRTGLGAKFSFTTTAAMALWGHDTARLTSFSDALCHDPAIMALRDKVSVRGDDLGSMALGETEAQVVILHTGGAALEARFDLNAPQSLSDRRARVQRKAAALIGATAANDVWRLIDDADGFDLDEFTAFLT